MWMEQEATAVYYIFVGERFDDIFYFKPRNSRINAIVHMFKARDFQRPLLF